MGWGGKNIYALVMTQDMCCLNQIYVTKEPVVQAGSTCEVHAKFKSVIDIKAEHLVHVMQKTAAHVFKTLGVTFSHQYVTYWTKCIKLDKYLTSMRSEIITI